MTRLAISTIIAISALATPFCDGFSSGPVVSRQSSTPSATAVFSQHQRDEQGDDLRGESSRRSFVTATSAAFAAAVMGIAPFEANAAPDCYKDCLKSCNLVAPKDPEYCKSNCQSYCDQPDRTDGLSGSVSSEGGEVGILGMTTVTKGEDKPPGIKIPGLDFSSDKGKKLLGY